MTSRPRLYLSHQRGDTPGPWADRLGERLADRFDVLLDRHWPAGSDHRLVEELDGLDAVVAIVDPWWLELLEEDRRLVRPGGGTAVLVAALNRPVPVVIVLVDGASLPEPDQLPEDLRPLVECESLVLTEETFVADVARLSDVLDRLVEPPKHPPAPTMTPASELVLDENVQFTVYRPRAVRPAEWYHLLAFAHLAERRPDAPADELDPLAQVRAQAEQLLGGRLGDYDSPQSDSRHGVPRDGEITFLPEIAGVEFNPERRVFRWQEDVHREEFRLRASPDLVGQTARGRLTVYLGVIILAEVNLALRVDSAAPAPQEPAPPPQPDYARPYRKIFASYSHRDVEVVRQFELLAASLGDEYLLDIARLRSGVDWDEALLRLIDDADVFQLFWSSNSMLSPYVRREWEYAMSLARPYFVRPTYWEDPLPTSRQPALPPDSLRRLHFSRIAAVPQVPAASANPMPVQAAAPAPPAPATVAPPPPAPPTVAAAPATVAPATTSRRRGRIRTILAPLAITVIVGSAFGGVLLSSLDSRNASVEPPSVATSAPVPSSAPSRSVTTTSPRPGDAPPTTVVEQHIPTAVSKSCEDFQLPDDSPLAERLLGAVRCRPTGQAAPRDVWYLEYADQTALSAAFADLTQGKFEAGDCQAAGQEFDYTTDEGVGDRVGRLRCYESQGVASLAWTHHELNVLAVAQDSARTFPELRSWWSRAGPYRDPTSDARSRPV